MVNLSAILLHQLPLAGVFFLLLLDLIRHLPLGSGAGALQLSRLPV